MIELEQITPAKCLGAIAQLEDRHAADARRAEHGANARAGDEVRDDVQFFERLHDADVGESLHAPAAKDEGNAPSFRVVATRHT
jgi:hypothetical protein